MIVNGTIVAKRLQRIFTKPTWILIQIVGAASLQLGRDMSEATLGGGGVILTSANSGGTTSPPYGTWWEGELWYSTTVDATLFSITLATDPADY